MLDLLELTFMDAAGLAVVIDADARAREAGRRLVVRVRSACVRRLLELTRAKRSQEIVADPEGPTSGRNGSEPPAWSPPDVLETFGWDVVRDGGSAAARRAAQASTACREPKRHHGSPRRRPLLGRSCG